MLQQVNECIWLFLQTSTKRSLALWIGHLLILSLSTMFLNITLLKFWIVSFWGKELYFLSFVRVMCLCATDQTPVPLGYPIKLTTQDLCPFFQLILAPLWLGHLHRGWFVTWSVVPCQTGMAQAEGAGKGGKSEVRRVGNTCTQKPW